MTASLAIPTLFFVLRDPRCAEIAALAAALLAIHEYQTLRPTPSKWATFALATIVGIGNLNSAEFLYVVSLSLVTLSLATEGSVGLHSGISDCAFYMLFLFPLSTAVSLARQGQGDLLVATVGLCFASDATGLVVGNLFGKHKLCASVSPGKTVEGFLAAVGVTAAIGALLTTCQQTNLVGTLKYKISDLAAGALFGGVVAVAGAAGDVFESALKRTAGTKDAGSILPGHGGILDRLDSLAPSFVVAYVWSQQTR